MKLRKSRKGFAVADLAPIAVAFVAVAVALGLGMQVLSDMAEDQCGTGYTYNESRSRCENSTGGWAGGAGETYESNSTGFGLEAGAELASWLPTIALIIAASVIIGVIVVYLARRFA